MASTASRHSSIRHPRLFLVISTGQNIANIIPILEIGAPAIDQVMWFESPRAMRSGWSDPAIKILEKYGFTNQKRLHLKGDGPRDFTKAAKSVLKNSGSTTKLKPIFVANGGTKTQALATYLDRSLPIIYNYDQPCAYEWFPQGIEGPSMLMPYANHRLDINDILYLRGMGRQESPKTICILGPNAKTLSRTRYGADPKYTIYLHDYVTERNVKQRPTYSERVKDMVNVLMEMKWSDFTKYAPNTVSQLKRSHEYAFKGITISQTLLKQLFFYWQKAFKEVLTQRSSRTGKNAPGSDNRKRDATKIDIGSEFEQAVALRVVNFLMANPQYRKIIHSAWKNMHIGKRDTNITAIECDILMALKNGILIHLECKSFHGQMKDLDARLLKLQQSASQLAKMAICSPCFTSFTEKPWFETHHTFKMKIEQISTFVHIPFDLPNQPRSYKVRGTHFTCHTFEEALGHFLDRWVPPHKS